MEKIKIYQKSKWRQLLCHHDYVEVIKIEEYLCLSGDTVECVCRKCGHIKGKYFLKHEGMGYK